MIRALLALMMMAAYVRADEWDTAIGQTEQVTRGLVGYWAMRVSGTNVFDEWTSGQTGGASGVTFGYSRGAVASGGTFNSNGLVQVAHSTTHWIGTNGTVSAWVKTTAHGAGLGYLVDKFNNSPLGADAGAVRGYILAVSSAKAAFFIGDATISQNAASAGSVNDGVWRHLVGTYDGTTIRIYVDGLLDGETASTRMPTETTEPLQLGSNVEAIATAHYVGDMDEVRIYNRALSADEIKQLYRMGALPRGIK
jgi:hypothetical protein